jgi:hypothetical protein
MTVVTLRRVQVGLAPVVVGFVLTVVLSSPAAAHGVGGVEPRNYETTVLQVSPSLPGVELSVVDLGDRLSLANGSGEDVVVLGYDDEPYLRVGPRGVFENRRSPAVYLNRSLVPTTRPPRIADAAAAPEWRKVSSSTTATWHDHRAHYMGSDDPPAVRRDPSVRHVVDRWVVELRAGDRTVRASGELVYVPPSSVWPFVAVAVALALVVILLSRTERWRASLAVALAVMVVSDLLHVVGLWDATTASTGSKLAASAYALVGVALGVLALGWMWRKGADAAMPFVLIAAIFIFFAGGLADVATIGHSQIPTTLAPTIARVLVCVNLGLGAGVATGAALHLRSAARARAPSRGRVPVTS